MAAQNPGDLFDAYFKRADLDRDGRISGAEAVAFFQGSNLSKQVLAQIWVYANQNRTGYLGTAEFYNMLKLVTVAQSKQDLTPEIVRSALYGPASAKIPAPQINLAGNTMPQLNAAAAAPSAPQLSTVVPTTSQNPGFSGAAVPPTANMSQQYNQSPASGLVRPPNGVLGVASRPVQGVAFQGFAAGGPPLGSKLANFRGSSGAGGTSAAGGPPATLPERGSSFLTTQGGLPSGTPGQVTSLSPRPPTTFGMTSSGIPAVQPRLPVSQNGFASGTLFGGDALSETPSQTKNDGSAPTSSGSFPVSSTRVLVSGSTSSKLVSLGSAPNSFIVQPVGGQLQKMQAPLKQNQQVPVQNIPPSGPRAASSHSSSGQQTQLQWPRPTSTDLQKYTKVFMEVDTDKDGKITGEQARNLFLSWRLPREVLKQVWDLSDQDNDSMLSLREFCIALYIMERYREGRPLPAVLPSNIMLDFPATAQQTGGYGNAPWGYSPGSQPQAMPGTGSRPPRPAGKPPLPVLAASSDDRIPPKQQKPKVPVLEQDLVDQLSEEEQKSLNLKFQEASDANKKVEDLEKDIKESREKMEFYRVKMQELVLYKSRCDSRFNEVSERAAADKREVESLAKKYEEKYRQADNVASKLTIEEATFRDIQEKKMEVYQAIVKLQYDGTGEDLQDRGDHIKSTLEELVKSLSEHCKKYGLRAKPTTLVELPFGWQPGIEGGAADWDEVWDKFEDEGFTFVKELTVDEQNVVAPLRTRAKVAKKEKTLAAEVEAAVPTSDAESKPVNPALEDERVALNGVIGNHMEDGVESILVDSPSARSSHASPHNGSKDEHSGKTVPLDASPRSKETQSDLRVTNASFSGNKSFSEPAWGTFDTNDDVDSVWDSSKEMDPDRHTDDLFGHGGWTLPPIKTGSSKAGGILPKMSIFADSVPGTPADGLLPRMSVFADSVPGTPADGFLPKKSIFADSVPSTPLFTSSYSPQKSGEGPEGHGFNFSRFDSFRSTDSGFQPHEGLSRFDSFRTGDFDSQNGRFSSFDDSDPFSSGPFKSSSFGSETPRREDAFGFSEPFRSSLGSETPRSEVDPFGSVGPFRSSLGSETPRADSDPFRSVGPFRSSLGSETPRADPDPFGSVGPFGSSLGSETPRRESDYFANSGSFGSSFRNETPRGDFDSFGFGGPFGSSSLGSETPRRESDAFGSVGPLRSFVGSETPKGGTNSWSAF